MSMSISIHPVSTYLDMYGEPDASSAYSLSGVVTISVSSPYSLFERRRTARLLLQSLSITFEGQSEIFTHDTGYTGLRLCSVTRELAPAEPLELTNEGHEDDAQPCQWDVLFNIPIPGWLPGSATLGMDEIGIRYGLYATANFANLDVEQGQSAWSFASFCSPFRSRARVAEASKHIVIQRYILPPQVERTTSSINYLVNSQSSPERADASKKRIPSEVLSKIQVLTSVPDFVDMRDGSIPITVRLRTKDLDAIECKRIQVTEIGINIIQQERCRYRPSAVFLAQYPIPPREQQPPNVPLRDPHPISGMFDAGLYLNKEHSESVRRSFSLLPEKETGKYKLADNNYAFASDAEQGDNPTWYTMETRIPFIHMRECDPESEEWAGPAILRPSSSSPLYSVSHDVSIALTFSYDLPDSDERARERLNFNVPLSFGNYLPQAPAPLTIDTTNLEAPSSSSSASSPPPFSNLPSYSQLYDSNGDRKIDLSTPLPLYTPHEKPDTHSEISMSEVRPSSHANEKPVTSFLDGAEGDETVPLLSDST